MARKGTVMTAGHARGFALLEVLVAFIITLVAVSLIIGTTSEALRGAGTAARYQEATVRAQSRLAAVADAGTPRPGEREGDDGDGFRWHERIAVLRSDAGHAAGEGAVPIRLFGISVWVTWRDGIAKRSVELETQRVIEAP